MEVDKANARVNRTQMPGNMSHTKMGGTNTDRRQNQTVVLGRSGVVVGLNKSIFHKKKAHKLVPKLMEKTKVITKGKANSEKV